MPVRKEKGNCYDVNVRWQGIPEVIRRIGKILYIVVKGIEGAVIDFDIRAVWGNLLGLGMAIYVVV